MKQNRWNRSTQIVDPGLALFLHPSRARRSRTLDGLPLGAEKRGGRSQPLRRLEGRSAVAFRVGGARQEGERGKASGPRARAARGEKRTHEVRNEPTCSRVWRS